MADLEQALAGLSRTDWSAFEHAYGPATDVPDLIRALVGPDGQARADALWQLHGNVIHQNTRYSVTPAVIGHLLNLVACDDVINKGTILKYLTNLVAGPYTLRDGFWICDGERSNAYSEEQAEIALACYRVAVRAVPMLLDLATGRFYWVRAAAICLLGCFRTERATIVPALRRRAAIETADAVRAAIAFALGLLTEGTPDFEGTLRVCHEDDPGKLTRAVAAIMLAMHGFGDGAVVATLVEALADLESQREYPDLTWGHERLAGDVGHALAHVAPEWGARAMPALGQALLEADRAIEGDRSHLVEVIGLVQAIAALAFPHGGAPHLLPAQRQAVELLVRARSPWLVTNATEILAEDCGLPTDREEAARLVGIEPESLGQIQRTVSEQVDEAAALVGTGNAEEALSTLALLPDEHPFVGLNRGHAFYTLDRVPEAIEALEQTTLDFPDFGPGWNLLACAYNKAGRFDEALQAVENAIRCNSVDPDYQYNRVVFRAKTGDIEGVFLAAHELVDRDPELLGELEAELAAEQTDTPIVTDPRWETVRLAAR